MLFIFEELSKAFDCEYYANKVFIQYIDFLFNKMLEVGLICNTERSNADNDLK